MLAKAVHSTWWIQVSRFGAESRVACRRRRGIADGAIATLFLRHMEKSSLPGVRRALPDLTQVSGAAAAPRSLAERPLPAPMEGVGLDDMALEAALDGFLPPGGSSTRVRDDHCVYGGLNFVSFVTSIDQQVRR